MKEFDAVIIGGGILGCFAARNLARWKLKTALLEQEADVCMGITRANAAILYAGYDNKPGSEKGILAVTANAAMDAICEELEVPLHRPGGLMTAAGERGAVTLNRKYANGMAKGVPGLRLISGEEAREREPMLTENVTMALYSPTTGTVNPWELGIAALENAVYHGCTPLLQTALRGIRRGGLGYVLETDGEEIACKAVLNCAGLSSDWVQELLFPPRIRLRFDASDFLVLNKNVPAPKHILFQETEHGKGVTAVPTVGGSLLLESPPRELTDAALESLQALRAETKAYLPSLDLSRSIRSFTAVRPRAYGLDGKQIHAFSIDEPEPGFVSLIGIKTPGLTCADQLGRLAADRAAAYLNARENPNFRPDRRANLKTEGAPSWLF